MTAAQFSAQQREIQNKINRAMRDFSREATAVLKVAAPYKTGQLRRRLASRIQYQAHTVSFRISSHAANRGFNYIPVTRIGHQTPVIFPKRAKALTFRPGGKGRKISRAWVRGYRPTHDWVDDAAPYIRALLSVTERRIGGIVQRTDFGVSL